MDRPEKDEALIRHIDEVLAEETTLQEGLERAVEMGWMEAAEAEACLRAYHETRINALPLDEYIEVKARDNLV